MPVDQWNVRAFEARLRGRLELVMAEIGELVARDARKRAPRSRGSGHMAGGGHAADTITHVESSEPAAVVTRVGAGKAGWYLTFAETGTSHSKAQPWLRPALKTNKRTIVRMLGGD